jgi:hypothetical protein
MASWRFIPLIDTVEAAMCSLRLTVLALTAFAVASCGGGSATVHVMPDGGDARDAAEAAERAPDVTPNDAMDAQDVSGEIGDAGEAADASEAVDVSDASDAREAGPDVAVADAADAMDAAADADADAAPRDVAPEAPAEVGADVRADLPAEKPPATASWTIAPDPMCTAAGAGCMDTGAVGGYQVTASGTCVGAPSMQLFFPGGMAAIAPGSYAVKPAAGILDVISMPAGKVGVLAERGTGAAHQRYWGRSGTVTVTVVGAARRVTLTGVGLQAEGTAATTTLAADVTCP